MIALIDPNSSNQNFNGTGSIIHRFGIDKSLDELVNILNPALTSSRNEVSGTISPTFNYSASAARISSSNPTQQDLDFLQAEILLTGANFIWFRGLSFSDKGGLVTTTGFRDSVNVLMSPSQIRELRYEFRDEALKIMRHHLFSNASQSLSGSFPNFTPGGERVIGSGRVNRSGKSGHEFNYLECDNSR